jgi:23S rRNA (uracil1939-C5)-methyltransferase
VSGPDFAGDVVRLTIEGLGGLGDGLARHRGAPVHVPLTAPGDVADVLIGPKRGDGYAGRLMAVVAPGADRRAPPCPHYGECGGCATQHLTPESYIRWKESLVGGALADRFGLIAVFYFLAASVLAANILTLFVPKEEGRA